MKRGRLFQAREPLQDARAKRNPRAAKELLAQCAARREYAPRPLRISQPHEHSNPIQTYEPHAPLISALNCARRSCPRLRRFRKRSTTSNAWKTPALRHRVPFPLRRAVPARSPRSALLSRARNGSFAEALSLFSRARRIQSRAGSVSRTHRAGESGGRHSDHRQPQRHDLRRLDEVRAADRAGRRRRAGAKHLQRADRCRTAPPKISRTNTSPSSPR